MPDKLLAYSTYVGQSGFDAMRTVIAGDPAGNVYVVGTTNVEQSPQLLFVHKLNSFGNLVVESMNVGGPTGNQQVDAAAVDSQGDLYLTGKTTDPAFPQIPPPAPGAPTRDESIFVMKLHVRPLGLQVVYSTLVGGTVGQQGGLGIAVDAAGSAYVAGYTESSDFPATKTFPGNGGIPEGVFERRALVFKLVPEGNRVVYSCLLGGASHDESGPGNFSTGCGIFIDAAGNAYVLGSTSAPDFVTTPGVFQPQMAVDPDSGTAQAAFITKLNPTGDQIVYSTLLGGTRSVIPHAIAVDSRGNAVVVGWAASLDFPFQLKIPINEGGHTHYSFVTKIDPTAATVLYSTLLGNGSVDSVALDDDGIAHVAGGGRTSEFHPISKSLDNAVELELNDDFFVASLDPMGNPLSATFLGVGGYQYNSENGEAGLARDKNFFSCVAGTTFRTNWVPSFAFKPLPTGESQNGFIIRVGEVGEFRFDTEGFEWHVNPVGNQIETLTVERAHGSFGEATVRILTVDGTALAGRDYLAIDHVLSFASGESSKVVPLTILANPTAASGDRSFQISLSQPTGKSQIGMPGTATVLLRDPPAAVHFRSGSVTVQNSVGRVSLTVRRDGSTGGQASVRYATRDGTAAAGIDYLQASSLLSFAPGDASAIIELTILDNPAGESGRTFTVNLSEPMGNIRLDMLMSATVFINR